MNNMKKGKLFIISGPSGSGKSSIYEKVLKDMKMEFSVSMTTRAPRANEKDGVDYYFVTQSEYDKVLAEDGFLEHAEIFGNCYGTLKSETLGRLADGRDVLLDIDIQGAMNIKKVYADAVYIFVLPPSFEELKRRIAGRGTETEETMKRRLGGALHEMSFIGEYDYCIINDNLETAIRQAEAVITAEHLKTDEDTYNFVNTFKEEE